MPDEVPFIMMCACDCGCDAGMEIESARQAVAEGWTEIQPHDGHSWNYLGVCPECNQMCEQ